MSPTLSAFTMKRLMGQATASFRVRSLSTKTSRLPKDGLTLTDFVSSTRTVDTDQIQAPDHEPILLGVHDHVLAQHHHHHYHDQFHQQPPRSFHLKTYGCQMNVSDSDIVRALLLEAGLTETNDELDADVLLTNTCAIREGAELKVWNRLKELKAKYKRRKVVGVLGCMAERLKEGLFQDQLADLVVGPDAYRDLPRLVSQLLSDDSVEQAVNVQLSLDETYADVTPVRRNSNDVSAFVSVMRGCNNMCSYCVVPFTRGRERSRPLESIVSEAKLLFEQDKVKEIILLGQNVNSYHDKSDAAVLAQPVGTEYQYQTSNVGFTNLYRLRGGAGYYFCDLVEAVSDISPELRVRFTSPHPKDYPPELLSLMSERANVCNQLHMPAQSGSSSVLQRMRRGYTREAYLQLLEDVRSTIPDVAISSDFISGFCSETQEEHEDTLSLMEQVQYDQAFMFAYSMRGKTHAHRSMEDNVAEDVKLKRLQEIIRVFREQVQRRNDETEVGRLRLVLVEGESKKSKPDNVTWQGRTDQNKRIVFPMRSDVVSCWSRDDLLPLLSQDASSERASTLLSTSGGSSTATLQPGDYAVVQVTEARGHSLRGQVMWRTSLASFSEMKLSHGDEQNLKDMFANVPSTTLIA